MKVALEIVRSSGSGVGVVFGRATNPAYRPRFYLSVYLTVSELREWMLAVNRDSFRAAFLAVFYCDISP